MLIEKINNLLIQTLVSNDKDKVLNIQMIQDYVWNDEDIQDVSLNDFLTKLAYILDFYEPNNEWRKEDPSYYGNEQLNEVLKKAIFEIEEKGLF